MLVVLRLEDVMSMSVREGRLDGGKERKQTVQK